MNETEWVQCDDPWRPEPPADDLRERRVWTCKIGGRVGVLPGGADAPMRRAVADAFTAETGYPVEFCFSGWGDDLDESELAVVEDRAPDPEVIRAALAKRLEALPAAPLPVPPWPGAVLSGLVDEDGVPTWLAQAGQVRGEQVRACTSVPWLPNTSYGEDEWVEVRAPRAVPEPETERVEPVTVRFYEAFGPTDFTDGRGPRKSMGVYPTEQEAWDSINDLPGVQGTHPSKGNTYPLRSREYEDCGPVLTWQRYREVVGRSGDYYVVERQVVGTPQATQ